MNGARLGELFNELVQVRAVVKLDHVWYFTSREETPLEVSTFDIFFVFVCLVKSSEESVCATSRNGMLSETQCRLNQDMKV
jgi:hypothetical protein